MSRTRPTVREFLSSLDSDVERQFFARVFLPNKTFKTTYPNRLDDLNKLAMPYLAALPHRPLDILDVGISSGTATLEWFHSLRSNSIECRMTATDLLIKAVLHAFPWGLAFLTTENLDVLHVDVLGSGIPPYFRKKDLSSFFKSILKLACRLKSPRTQPVQLLSHKFDHSSIVTREDNLLNPNPPEFVGAFDAVRVANLLNLNYFSTEDLLRMCQNVQKRLRSGGILIVCRTHADGTNHATIFRNESGRFSVLSRLAEGSEIEDIIMNLEKSSE